MIPVSVLPVSNSHVTTIMKTTIATEAPTSASGATTTCQTADDDIEEGKDAIDDGEKNEADTVDDTHDYAADYL
jgi:hypothetical protein